MKKKILLTLLTIVVLIIVTCITINHFFFSMNTLPTGELIDISSSPNEDYTLSIYLVNSHATVSYAIRGELKDNRTGEIRNIYWDYRIDKAVVIWESPWEVNINGHLIEIPNGEYDFRHNK